MSELVRLAYIVRLIEEESALVPTGALFLAADKQILPSSEYKGLSLPIALLPSSYRHFRDSTNPHVREKVANTLYHFAGDFFDSIEIDEPKGIWTIKADDEGKRVFVQNAAWPGYSFEVEIGTKKFGGTYFGDGIKQTNVALLF